jgi:hypothetical protein
MMSLISKHRSPLLAALAGFLFGLWFIGPVNVWPTSTKWLSSGDMAHAQYMWEYFRRTPLVQWPITAVRPYGEDWGTIFPATAGNVLAGLPVKFLSSVLPAQFQYLGLWTLSTFVLQGVLAERLFVNFGLQETERVLGAMSFLIAPAFLFRIGMTHLDLSTHWLVIAALALYFSRRRRALSWDWLALLVVTMLVHMYLFVIVFVTALAAAVRRFLSENSRCTVGTLAKEFFLLTATSISVWFILGYSSFLGSAKGEGFFRLNSLAFFNPGYGPEASYSRLLDQIPSVSARSFFAEEGEGFAYLGLVGVAGCAVVLLGIRRYLDTVRRRENIPILITAGILFAAALSNRVAIVRREFEYPLPRILIEARQIFRVANRFSWLAYYLVLAIGWVAVARLARKFRFSKLVLAGLLLIAVTDQSRGIVYSRSQITNRSEVPEVLRSPRWEVLGQQLSRMYLIPTFDVQDDELPDGAEVWLNNGLWNELIAFGAKNNLTTNFAYVGRPVTDQVRVANERIKMQLDTGMVPRDSVLFFADGQEWKMAQLTLGSGAEAVVLDGLFVIITREGIGS